MYRCALAYLVLAALLPGAVQADAHLVDPLELPPPQALASAQADEFEPLVEVMLEFGTGYTALSKENAAILDQTLERARKRLAPYQDMRSLVIVINGAADSVRTVIRPGVPDSDKRQHPANTSFASARAAAVHDYLLMSNSGATLSVEGELVSNEHSRYPAACFVRIYQMLHDPYSSCVTVTTVVHMEPENRLYLGASGGYLVVGPHSAPMYSLDAEYANWRARIGQAGEAQRRGDHEIYFSSLTYTAVRSSSAEVAVGLLGFRAWEFAENRSFIERRTGVLIWPELRWRYGPLRLALGGGIGLSRFTDGHTLNTSTDDVGGVSVSGSLLFDIFK